MKKILTILLIVLVQTCCFAETTTQTSNINNGRYVMYMNPLFRGDQFVLDTQTGKIWQMVAAKDGGVIFQQVFYKCLNSDKSTSELHPTPH